jgi:hypothetical protein
MHQLVQLPRVPRALVEGGLLLLDLGLVAAFSQSRGSRLCWWLRGKPKAAQLDGFIDFRQALRRSRRGIAFGGDAGVSRVEFSSDGGMKPSSARTKEIQFSDDGIPRMAHKAPTDPKDVDAIVYYLISIRGANQAGGRRVALLVKHQQTSHHRRAA